MQRIKDFFEKGTIVPIALGASAIVGLLAIIGYALLPTIVSPIAEMRIVPSQKTILLGEKFSVDIVVSSAIPVNVFAAELIFDNEIITVTSIDYHTSIADLWAERPWFSNGEGTLNFVGGTTKSGGFFGTAKLITVHFMSLREGSGTVGLRDVHILQHDELGTEVTLTTPIDKVVIVNSPAVNQNNLVTEERNASPFTVVRALPSTDINGDGKHSIADISIFMLHITGDDPRYDFNGDGDVNTVDLNILMGKL